MPTTTPSPPQPQVESDAEPLRALQQRLARQRPTYHAFEHCGRRLVYELWSGSVLALDEPAFEVLAALERGTPLAHIAERVSGMGASVREVAAELDALGDAGLFRLEALESSGEREETVAAHLAHAPNKLMLLVQTVCNLKCGYCYEVQAGFHRQGQAMSFETAARAVEFLIQRSRGRRELEVTFFGGEPLLDVDLIRRVVEHCRARGREAGKDFFFQITTNGLRLSDEVIEFLVRERFSVMLSVDGPPEQSDLHRVDLAGRGVGARVLANARKLVAAQKAAGLRPATVRATMAPGNTALTLIDEFFEAQGFERTMIGASVGRAHAKGPCDVGPQDLAGIALEVQHSMERHLAWLDGRATRPAGSGLAQQLVRLREALAQPRRRAGVGCGVGRNMQAIAADGAITPCHRYAGEREFVLGDLDQGLDAARVERYYREILDNYDRHCSGCWARLVCGGQCPWYVSRPDGHVGVPDDASCTAIRRGLERALWFHAEIEQRRARRTAQIQGGQP